MPDSSSQPVALGALPHRAPFRFVTGVEALEPGSSARGWWEVSGQEPFLAGHFPGQPLVPGVLIAEALAQLSGVVVFSGASSAAAPAASVAHLDVRFRHPVEPPATVDLRVRLVRSMGRLHQFDVEALVDCRPVAHGSLVLAESGQR